MSNLFIKFLPVEGEIKENDSYVTSVDPTIRVSKQGSHNLWSMGITKVLPHLCSSNIQVGDKMTILTKGLLWGEVGEECTLIANHRNRCEVKGSNGITYTAECDIQFAVQEGNVTKVLGLLSPDAVWITNGMEVKEEDVQEWWFAPKVSAFIEIKSSFEDILDRPNLQVAFKLCCPTCKTFH